MSMSMCLKISNNNKLIAKRHVHTILIASRVTLHIFNALIVIIQDLKVSNNKPKLCVARSHQVFPSVLRVRL